MDYEVQEHVGDAKLHSSGESLDEAFRGMTMSFAEVCGTEPLTGNHTHTAKLDSEGLRQLLYDFLDELIFIQDVDFVAVTGLQEVELEDLEEGWSLKAEVEVKELDPAMKLRDIKAPTYSEMEADFRDSEWQLTAVLDL